MWAYLELLKLMLLVPTERHSRVHEMILFPTCRPTVVLYDTQVHWTGLDLDSPRLGALNGFSRNGRKRKPKARVYRHRQAVSAIAATNWLLTPIGLSTLYRIHSCLGHTWFSDKLELETDPGGRHENKKKINNRRCGPANREYHLSIDSQLSC